MTDGFDWTIEDVYAAQGMCPYETVAYGSSKFCELFTYEEWQGFGYSIDLWFAGGSTFHSPTGVRPRCRLCPIFLPRDLLTRPPPHREL